MQRDTREMGMPATLVTALKRKDPTAFAQLLAQHGAMLYRVALRLMGQQEEAEEVVQQTLVTVYAKIATFDDRAALTTWLYREVELRMALPGLSHRAAETLVNTAHVVCPYSNATRGNIAVRLVLVCSHA